MVFNIGYRYALTNTDLDESDNTEVFMKHEYETNEVHQITLLGVPIVEVGLNSEWWIYSMEYDGKVPPNEIEELTVTFKKAPKQEDGEQDDSISD